jgi:Uma2 family endonuclease
MSYVPAESRVEWLPHGHAFTRADLDAMPDNGNRYELVDGAIVVTPAPDLQHQVVVSQIWLRLYRACPADMRALFAPFDVTLSEDSVVQPDVLVAARSEFDDKSLKGTPLLVVEVLSPTTRHLDLAFKRARYEAAGCPSYWVVDPLEPSIVCWELRDGRYEEVASATGTQPITLTAPFPISFAPEQLID